MDNDKIKSFQAYLESHQKWSLSTFGPGQRLEGVCRHIESELVEIRESDGGDLYEWVDVIILAIDGAWRAGFTARDLIKALWWKQARNKEREWPTVGQDEPSYHVKE